MSLGYQYIFNTGAAVAAAAGSSIEIALSPVVVEVALVTPNVGYDQEITLSPVVVEAVLVTPDVDLAADIEIELTPVVVEVSLLTPDVAVRIEIELSPVVVEVSFVAPAIAIPNPTSTGITGAIFHTPAGVQSGGPIEAIFHWETHRKLNAVGSWTIEIPVGEALVATIDRGWFVSLVQENTHPLNRLDLEYLMYRGIVEDKTYRLDESGVPVCQITGSFRGLALAARSTPTVASYTNVSLTTAATAIVDGLGGGITCPADGSRSIKVAFNDGEGHEVVGRYSRLLRIGEYARWALRESWEEDAFEFVSLDAPPDSGYVMVNAEAAASGQSPGMALIGATPEIRREGRGIVNRVIPFGSDVVYRIDVQAENILTLAETRMGVNPGGGFVQLTPVDPPFLQIDTQPTAGKTLTIAGVTYLFTAGATALAGRIGIGADVAAARLAIVAAVNATDGFNSTHPTVEMFGFGDSGMTANRARMIIVNPGTLGTTTIPTSGTFTDDADNEFDEGNLSEALEEVNVPLTLEHSTLTTPYAPVMGVNDDGSNFWYLEDAASIARHGLVEMPMHRTDVKNPNPDNDATRTQAANVLHQIATLELHRHRAPKLYFAAPVANGDEVWALPGDKLRVVYSGNVLMDGEVTLWQEIDRWLLVIERHEQSSESGVRMVSFVLAVPDVADVEVREIPEDPDVPGVPEVPVSPADDAFAVTTDDGLPQILTSLGIPTDGFPGFGGSLNAPCCEESTTITDLEPPGGFAGIPSIARTRGVTIGPDKEIWGEWIAEFENVESPIHGSVLGIITVQTNNAFVPTIESASLTWTERYSETFGDVTLSIFTAPIPEGFGFESIALGAGIPSAWTNYMFDTVAGGVDVVQVADETDTGVSARGATLAAPRTSGNVLYSVLGRSNILDAASHPPATETELTLVGDNVTTFQTASPLEVMLIDSAAGSSDSAAWAWEGSAADAVVVLLEIEVS